MNPAIIGSRSFDDDRLCQAVNTKEFYQILAQITTVRKIKKGVKNPQFLKNLK